MNINSPSELTSKVSHGKSEGRFLGPLRAAALTAVIIGAVGSVGFLLRAGHPPIFLRVLFTIWVLSPFVILALADVLSKRWSVLTRAVLYSMMLVLTLVSLAVYVEDALRPRPSQPAFVFVLVPPVSWLLIAIAIPIAALVSRRLSPRVDRLD